MRLSKKGSVATHVATNPSSSQESQRYLGEVFEEPHMVIVEGKLA